MKSALRNQTLIDQYNESFIEQANEIINELSKIPDAAWTNEDFCRNAWAINALNQLNEVKK
tara:strand:+ start:507 stop:689 length:183 start_codon:yes stop_codon:yes gene_type:complete